MTPPKVLRPTEIVSPSNPLAPWQKLRVGDWQSFFYDHGHFLLHVPSGHVLGVPPELALAAGGETSNSESALALASIKTSLPLPTPKTIKTDIRAVSLNMAQGCNLRCTYCFAGEGDYGQKGLMSTEVAIKALSLLSAGKSSFHVVFFGGEPLLNFAVIQEVVAWAERQAVRFSFSMTSNGTLLTRDKLIWLKSKKFSLNLSYDGPGLQDRQRRNKDSLSGSEATIERKLKTFEHELANLHEIRLRATVTKNELGSLEYALLQTLTSRNLKVFLAHHTSSDKLTVFSVADIQLLGQIIENTVTSLLASEQYEALMRFENIKQGISTLHLGKTGQMACGAGVHYLSVSISGKFYLCHRFNEDQEEQFGCTTKGLDETRLQEIVNFRNARKAPCDTCWMREWCRGGCFHEHKTQCGDKFNISPLYCQLQDLEMKAAMRVYTVLLTRAPQLLN